MNALAKREARSCFLGYADPDPIARRLFCKLLDHAWSPIRTYVQGYRGGFNALQYRCLRCGKVV